MTPNPRQALLLDEVRTRGSVSVEALAEQFDVTLQTVRRDVKLLADAGLLARFHGGVRVPSSTIENIEYLQRQLLNEQAKQRIARKVVLLAQQHAVAAPGQVAGNAGAIDAAADHEHVKCVATLGLRGGRNRRGLARAAGLDQTVS